MAAALLAEGKADEPATFSLFVRNLPPSRGYLVAAGLHEAVRFLRDWRFDDEAVDRLGRAAPFDPAFLDWLREVRFTGRVRAVPEGRIVFANEPLLEIDAPFGAAQLLETDPPQPLHVPDGRGHQGGPVPGGGAGPDAGRLRPPAGPRRRRRDGGRPGGGHRRVRRHLQRGRRRPLRPPGQRHHGPLLRDRRGRRRRGGRARRLPDLRRALPGRPRPPRRHLGHAGGIDHAIVVAQELAADTRDRAAGAWPASGSTPATSWRWPAWPGSGSTPPASPTSPCSPAAGSTSTRSPGSWPPARRSTASASAPTSPPRPTPRRWRPSTSWWRWTAGRWPSARPARRRCPGAKQVWRRPGFGGDVLALADEPDPVPGAEPLLEDGRPRRRTGRPGSGGRRPRAVRSGLVRPPEGVQRPHQPHPVRGRGVGPVTSSGRWQLRPRMTARGGPVPI